MFLFYHLDKLGVNKKSPQLKDDSTQGLDPKVIITRLMKLMQNPDYIEELRMKLEMIKGFE